MANQKKAKAGGNSRRISGRALMEYSVVGICTLMLASLPVLMTRISAPESVIKVKEALADWCTPSICFLVLIAGVVVATSGVLWGEHHQQEGNMMKHQERNIITESLLIQRPVANSQIDPLCMPDIFFSIDSARANAIAQAARANTFTNPVRISPPIPTGLPEYYPAYVGPQSLQLVLKSEEDFKDGRGFVKRGFEDRGFVDRGFQDRRFDERRFEERRFEERSFEDRSFDERRFPEGGRYLKSAVVVDSEDENNSEGEDRFDEHEAGYEPEDEGRFVHVDKVRFQPDEASVIYDAEDERRYHSEGGDGRSETEEDDRFDDFRYPEEGSDSDSEDEGKYDPGFEVHPLPLETSSPSPQATKHFPQMGIVSNAIDSPPPIVVHPHPPVRWTPIQVSSRNIQEQDFHPLIGIPPNAPSRRQSHGVPTFTNVQVSPPALPIADISPVKSIHMREMVPYIDHKEPSQRESLSPDSHTVAATNSSVAKVPSPPRPSTFETAKRPDTVVAAASSAVRGSTPKVLSPPKSLNTEPVATTRVEAAAPVNVIATSSPKTLDSPKLPKPEVAVTTRPEIVAPVAVPTISTTKTPSPQAYKPAVASSTTARSEIAVSGPASNSTPKVPSLKAQKSEVPKSVSPVSSSRPSSPNGPEAEAVVLTGRESATIVAPPREVSRHKSSESEVVSSGSRQANGERMPSVPASKTSPPILQRQLSIPRRRPREVMVADYDPAEETDRKHDPLSDDDLDQRIEAYIKNFREQMRLQRQESLLRHRRGAGDT